MGTTGVEFFVLEWGKRLMFNLSDSKGGSYDRYQLKIWEVGMAGALSGLSLAFICCPIEFAKIQKQLNPAIPHSSAGLLLQQCRPNGFKVIFTGFLPTAIR